VIPVLLVLGVASAWHHSDRVLVPDHDSRPEDVTVHAVAARTIELERTEETARRGITGLTWQGGHAVVGRPLRTDDESVTRSLTAIDGYLPAGQEVAINPSTYVGDPRQARGLPFVEIGVAGELGKMPAWLVPARGEPRGSVKTRREGTWAIFVHGINDDPEVAHRLTPAIRRAGLPLMSITYREDEGAPPSPDGFHHMGLTEWRDLEAAATYALAHGARGLVLVGYSMGGSIATQFMQNSALASRVSALILDSPALDWERILEFNATAMGLPGFLSIPVRWAIGARIDADWESLNALGHTEDLQLPILLFHGTEDEVVPIETSTELAAALPSRVTYHRVSGAGHTQSWNVGPRLYEQRASLFLEEALDAKRARPESGSR
jgi:uncharacterized protein